MKKGYCLLEQNVAYSCFKLPPPDGMNPQIFYG